MNNRSVQVTINLQQEHENLEKIRSNTYHFSGGLVEYVLWLNNDKVCFIYRLYFTSFQMRVPIYHGEEIIMLHFIIVC